MSDAPVRRAPRAAPPRGVARARPRRRAGGAVRSGGRDPGARAGIARSLAWRRLLHYRAGASGRVASEVDGKEFFLAPDGAQSPEAELEATLHAFFLPDRRGAGGFARALSLPRAAAPPRRAAALRGRDSRAGVSGALALPGDARPRVGGDRLRVQLPGRPLVRVRTYLPAPQETAHGGGAGADRGARRRSRLHRDDRYQEPAALRVQGVDGHVPRQLPLRLVRSEAPRIWKPRGARCVGVRARADAARGPSPRAPHVGARCDPHQLFLSDPELFLWDPGDNRGRRAAARWSPV